MTDGEVSATEEKKLVHPMMVRFLYGQYANLFKFALWWTTLAPLTFALFENDARAIGVGRIVYNVALCVLSPIGGIVCERVHPRKVLLGAASVRFVIWCLLVPGMWLLFDSTLVSNSQTAVWILFNLFLALDGASVALSTVLDIDLCGVDIVAGRFGFEVTDEHRNQFNGRQELFFAACFTLFTPGMAFLGLAIHKAFEQLQSSIPEDAMEAGTLCGIFLVTFAIATVLQFYFFSSLPDDGPNAGAAEQTSVPQNPSQYSLDERKPLVNDTDDHHNNDPAAAEDAPPSGWEAVRSVPSDLLEAMKVIWAHPPILFRLVFLGLEIAFEDAAIVVIASQMGITLPWLGDNDSVNGNIWTSVGVACGKFGGAVASYLMIRFYHPPEQPRQFMPIFVLILLSCCVIFAFPAMVHAHDVGAIGDNGARALFLAAFFVYFFLSTLPKLGLMCLFQSMVSQVENGPRVFGFIAIVATTFDALVVMGLSLIFVNAEFNDALWITAFVYLAHGVLEMIIGPLFVLRPLQAAADNHEAEAPSQPSESSPLAVASSAELPAGPQAGTYTQRSASILVGVSNAPTSPRGVPSTSHRAAFMSVSQTFAHGSVAVKRLSNLDHRAPPQAHHTAAVDVPTRQPASPRDVGSGSAFANRSSYQGGGGLVANSYTRQGSRLAPMSPRNK